jgi:hypothetical protein
VKPECRWCGEPATFTLDGRTLDLSCPGCLSEGVAYHLMFPRSWVAVRRLVEAEPHQDAA